MFSYWEKTAWADSDILIIGAGIVGLSTAYSLLEKNPELRVTILERSFLPTGASTKNAGFACFGSLTELLSDIQKYGESAVVELVEMRWKGLNMLTSRLNNIDYENFGGYELITEKHAHCVAKINYVNQLLYPIFQQNVFSLSDSKIQQFGLGVGVKQLVYNSLEGQIHAGKMVRELTKRVQEMGALVITGAEVVEIEKTPHEVICLVQHPHLRTQMEFKAKSAAICTNAFSLQFFPELNIEPGRGQVLITQPIENLQLKGTFHFDEGFFYFRNVGNRILLGGGRNHFLQQEKTLRFGLLPEIQELLTDFLHETIAPNKNVKIDSFWSGIMAFGNERMPILQKQDNIVIGVRMGGMGVALGSVWGEKIANLLLN